MNIKQRHRCLTAKAFSAGVIVPSLLPFDENGVVSHEHLEAQTRVFSQTNGVIGVAMFLDEQEQDRVSLKERREILKIVKATLEPSQILLAHTGAKFAQDDEIASDYHSAGADVIICASTDQLTSSDIPGFSEVLDSHSIPPVQFPRPTLLRIEHTQNGEISDFTNCIEHNTQLLGFVFGEYDNISGYDQLYYAAKSIDRPLACLSSSESALFHSLNTGCDGILSYLSFCAPAEVSSLFVHSKDTSFF